MDPDQTAPIGAVCSGSTLFASILISSVMLGNYLQQTTSTDDIFRCIFLQTSTVVEIILQGILRTENSMSTLANSEIMWHFIRVYTV